MVTFIVHPAIPQGTATVSEPNTTVVIIPARYDSTRLPGKPLVDINGSTMIEHVYRRANAALSVDTVIVATDDVRIYDTVTAFGGEARMTLATHRNGTERLAELAPTLECDFIVNLQSDEPLIDPLSIDMVISKLIKQGPDKPAPMSTLRCPLSTQVEIDDPNIVKVVVDSKGFALYFSRSKIPHTFDNTRQTIHPVYKHIGLYAYKRDFLITLASLAPSPLEKIEKLEQLRALEYGYRISTVEVTNNSIGVDTSNDLEQVRKIMSDGET